MVGFILAMVERGDEACWQQEHDGGWLLLLLCFHEQYRDALHSAAVLMDE